MFFGGESATSKEKWRENTATEMHIYAVELLRNDCDCLAVRALVYLKKDIILE